MVTVARVDAAAPVSPPSPPAGRRTSRHPGDAVRLGLAVFVLAVSLLAVERDRLTLLERDLFRLVNDLPTSMRLAMVLLMQGGNVVAAPAVALVALARRRRR